MFKLWCALLVVAGLPAVVQAQEERPVDAARVESELSRLRAEPSVDVLVRAARARRTASPGRVRDAMDRARATGWLPTTRALVRRGQAVDLRAWSAETTPTNVSTDDDLVLEARVTFRFDRIVYAPQEAALLRELRAVEAAQASLTQTVIALYYERRRLQLELALTHPNDLARRVRVVEIESLLDALTGGAFHRPRGPR